jgi:hypothetical protein
MQGINDKRKTLGWQDVILVVAAMACGVLSTIDPDGRQIGDGLRIALLGAGALLGGWFFYRLLATTPGFSDRKKRTTALLFIFFVHVVATGFFFPLGDLLNDQPVISLDHAFHYYQVARAGEVFLETGRLHCYDPYYMAGHPTGLFDLDMKAAELFCTPFSGSARSLKFFILLCYLTIVLTIYKGSRYLGFTYGEAIAAVLLTLTYWHWGRPYASHFRYAGMFEFVAISHMSLLVVGLFRRFLLGKSRWAFFVLGPLAFLVHPTGIVTLAVPFLVLIVIEHRSLTIRKALLFTAWCFVVLAVNAMWIWPMVQNIGLKTASDSFFQLRGPGGLLSTLARPGTLPATGIVALSLAGAVLLYRQRRFVEAFASSGGALFLVFVAAFGIYLPGLRHLEPGRFLLPALIFAMPCAGAALQRLLVKAGQVLGERRGPALARLALTVLAMSPLFLSLGAARAGYHHRLSTRPTSDVRALIDAVQVHTTPEGRLMIEDGPAYLYGDAHLPGLLALYTGVQQIGGPYPFTFIRHHFTTFQRDKTMGAPLSYIPLDEMWVYLDLYNVLWIVTATDEAEAYFDLFARYPFTGSPRQPVEQIWRGGPYTIWQVNRQPAFASDPRCRIEASYNSIAVEIEPGVEDVLIKYHWDKGLSVNLPAVIEPETRADDPVPFIRLRPNGEQKIWITY